MKCETSFFYFEKRLTIPKW